MARTPHGYHDTRDDRARPGAAGFAERRRSRRRRAQPRGVAARAAVAYCQGTPLRTEIEAREQADWRRRPACRVEIAAASAAARSTAKSRRTS